MLLFVLSWIGHCRVCSGGNTPPDTSQLKYEFGIREICCQYFNFRKKKTRDLSPWQWSVMSEPAWRIEFVVRQSQSPASTQPDQEHLGRGTCLKRPDCPSTIFGCCRLHSCRSGKIRQVSPSSVIFKNIMSNYLPNKAWRWRLMNVLLLTQSLISLQSVVSFWGNLISLRSTFSREILKANQHSALTRWFLASRDWVLLYTCATGVYRESVQILHVDRGSEESLLRSVPTHDCQCSKIKWLFKKKGFAAYYVTPLPVKRMSFLEAWSVSGRSTTPCLSAGQRPNLLDAHS